MINRYKWFSQFSKLHDPLGECNLRTVKVTSTYYSRIVREHRSIFLFIVHSTKLQTVREWCNFSIYMIARKSRKNCGNSHVQSCVTLKIILPVFFLFSCMVEHDGICKLYLVKIKRLKLRSDCRPFFFSYASFAWKLKRYSYGVQFGIYCTALDQSKLSNFVECTINQIILLSIKNYNVILLWPTDQQDIVIIIIIIIAMLSCLTYNCALVIRLEALWL